MADEMPIEEPTEEPVEQPEGTEVEAPETGEQPLPSEDPYHPYGGKEAVEKAVELHKTLQTEDGVWQMFFQAGRALGLGVREIEALFQQQQGATQEVEQANMPADDDVLTYAEFKRLMDEQVLRPQQEQQRQQQEYIARQTIDSTMSELGVADNDIRMAVLQLGDRYLTDDISPQAVKTAVLKGHADYLKLVESERKKYMEDKKAKAASVPKVPAGSPGGAGNGDDNQPPPKDVAEAIQRARARMRAMTAG